MTRYPEGEIAGAFGQDAQGGEKLWASLDLVQNDDTAKTPKRELRILEARDVLGALGFYPAFVQRPAEHGHDQRTGLAAWHGFSVVGELIIDLAGQFACRSCR